MLSVFLLTHHEMVLQHEGRVRLSEQTLAATRCLLCRSIPSLDHTLLQGTRSIATIRTFYQLHADLILGAWVPPYPDSTLLYSAVFQRFYDQLVGDGEEIRRSRAVLGVMIQGVLMQLLCEIDPSQVEPIISMQHMKNAQVNGEQWEKNLIGASACAAVASTLLTHRPNVHLFLPTLEEDMRRGVDLFWVEHGLGVSVSIQAVGGMNDVRAYLASRPVGKNKGDELNKKLLRARDGTAQLNAALNMNWIPIVIRVGKPHKVAINILASSDHAWCEEIWEKIAGRNLREVSKA